MLSNSETLYESVEHLTIANLGGITAWTQKFGPRTKNAGKGASASSELECFLVQAALCSVGATNCSKVQRRKILHQIRFSQLWTRTLRVRVARKCYCSTLATCPQHKKEESKSPSLIEEARCCLISPTDCLRGSCQPAGCS